MAASCSTILEFDEDYTLRTPGMGGGGGHTSTDCPPGEQDHDGDGTCEPECDEATCSGHGSCDDSSGTPTCDCDSRFDGDDCTSCAEGYAGSDCSGCASGYQDGNDDGTCEPECDDDTCSGHGTCDDSSGTATCTCHLDYGGDDCGTPCPDGTAGPSCAFRIIFGLDIAAETADWAVVSDVPYDIDDAANASAFDRVAYRLILDDEQVWVEMDPFTSDAAELGMPVDVIHDVPITNVTVVSLSSNQASIAEPTDGNVEMWSSCYSAGPNGEYDYDDDITPGTDCYGCVQVHVDMQTVLAFNRWSSGSGTVELGIGPSPTGNPDYTFEQNADDYASRRLEVYIREP